MILIFQEMTSLPLTPLTSIAATPGKEIDHKFEFNSGFVKVIILFIIIFQ